MRMYILIMFTALCFSLSAQEVEKSGERSETATQILADVRMAYELAQFGYLNEAPLALIQAAEILMKYPQDGKWDIVLAERGEEKSDTKDNDMIVDLDPVTLMQDAKDLAAADLALLAFIESFSMAPNRGRLGGPGRVVERVEPRSNDIYTIKFWGNEVAEILVSGDGDTDLDLYVYDENGNLVAKDTDNTDDCYVRFFPKWTGPFKVKIVNHGSVFNRYIMLTN